MDTHKNVPFTAQGRMRMVQAVVDGTAVAAVAQAFRVDRKTVRKWVRRFEQGGREGLCDASCRPPDIRRLELPKARPSAS